MSGAKRWSAKWPSYSESNRQQLHYSEQVSLISWMVEEEGHMGHHIKEILTFPKTTPSKRIQVVVREVGEVSQRVFEWPMSA